MSLTFVTQLKIQLISLLYH